MALKKTLIHALDTNKNLTTATTKQLKHPRSTVYNSHLNTATLDASTTVSGNECQTLHKLLTYTWFACIAPE